MPDIDRKALTAAMAEKLAPVLGEAAVYEPSERCQAGHIGYASSGVCWMCAYVTAGGYYGDRFWPQMGKSLKQREADRLLDAEWVSPSHPTWHVAKAPVDFADPAEGWGVLERYLKATSSYLTLDHNTEGSVFEAHVFPDLAYQLVHEGYADTAWGAVIMAWAQALGVSGDA